MSTKESVAIDSNGGPPRVEVAFTSLSRTLSVPVVDTGMTNAVVSAARSVRAILTAGQHAGAPKKELKALAGVSGVLPAGTSTLVLGNPGSGKTSLLKAIAGRALGAGVVGGVVTYNGATKEQLLARGVHVAKLCAYAPQSDDHEPLLTVRETLEFVAANAYAARAPGDVQATIDALGLGECAEVVIGDELRRGVSGGQKKRVTVGEAMLSGARVLALDQITDGLDSATAQAIIEHLARWARATGGTVVAALQAPTPETFAAFDAVILLSDGHVLYHGPPGELEAHLARAGFACPPFVDVADFALSVATSPAYAARRGGKSAAEAAGVTREALAAAWAAAHPVALSSTAGVALVAPGDKAQYGHAHALSFAGHTAVLLSRQLSLVRRNPAVSIGRVMQFIILASIFGSVYGKIGVDNFVTKISVAIFACSNVAFAGFAEMPAIFAAKKAAFRQLEGGLFPAASWVLSFFLAGLPANVVSTFLLGTIMYWMTGFANDVGRYFFWQLALIAFEMGISSIFRIYGFAIPTPELAQVAAGASTGVFLLFGGFYISYDKIPNYCWPLYYISPFSWAVRSMMNSEFTAGDYQLPIAPPFNMQPKGQIYLAQFGISESPGWKWGGIGLLLFYYLFFGPFISTLIVMYGARSVAVGAQRIDDDAFVAAATAAEADATPRGGAGSPAADPAEDKGAAGTVSPLAVAVVAPASTTAAGSLPFVPVTLTFKDITYSVTVKGDKGAPVEKPLLRGVSGFAVPGTMTALMGASGAGKTTLLDVLAFRKTTGKVGGTIALNGVPASTAAFSAVAAYCEQTDIHADYATVREALEFSAGMRLPASATPAVRAAVVAEVMRLLELEPLAGRRTGSLAQGERKRLTIGVELVSNPSVLFLDEPTTGLDARSASAVVRVIRNVASTGRTVVATIHQPSAEVFLAFDSLLLLVPGGYPAFFGTLGKGSANLVGYLSALPGVPGLPKHTNPATWLLNTISPEPGALVSSSSPHAENPAAPGDIAADVAASSTAKALTLRDPSAAKAASGDPEAPARARTDFVAAYAASELSLAASKAVAANLAAAPPGAAAPRPPVTASAGAKFSALLSRMLLFHWRNTGWTNVKLYVYLFLALLFGLMYLGISDSDLSGILSKTAVALNGIAFMGIVTFNTGLTNWGDYRRVFYREKAAGYYPAPLYALSVYLAEVPSVAFNTLAYTAINYFMVGFSSNAGAFFTAYLATFLGTLWYTSLGMLFIGWLPITLLAQILGGPTTQITLLFAGVNLPKRDLPEAWKFLYEADGMAEALRLFMLPQYPTCTTPGCPTVAVGAAQLAGYSGPVLASNGAGYVVYKNDWAASRLDMTYDNRWNSLGYLVALQAGALVLIIFVYTRINHQSR